MNARTSWPRTAEAGMAGFTGWGKRFVSRGLRRPPRLRAALIAVALAGCRTLPPPELTGAEPRPQAFQPMPQPAEYEQLPVFDARDLLVSEHCAGAHFVVDSMVANTGFTNRYLIRSDFGAYQAAGAEMVAVRAAEIEAIARLQAMGNATAFGKGSVKGLGDAALAPVREAVKIVKNPLHIVQAIPEDIIKVYGLFDTARTIARAGLNRETVNELSGFNSAEKDLARSLGVEPDAINSVLREELFRKARPYFFGFVPARLAEEYMPEVPFPEVVIGEGGASAGEAVRILRREFTPNRPRHRLRTMGVARPARKALEETVWFTGHGARAMVRALARLEGAEGRGAYVDAALGVSSADRAHHFARMAQLIALYHEQRAPIRRIALVDGGDAVVAAADAKLVVFIFGDHVVWSREVAAVLADPAASVPEGPPATDIEVVVSGTLSERTRAELTSRGYSICEGAFERLMPPQPEKKWYARWWNTLESL